MNKKQLEKILKRKREILEYVEWEIEIFAKEWEIWDKQYKKLMELKQKMLKREISVLEWLLQFF